MPNSDLLPSLLFKVNENQLDLEAAIIGLTLWAEKRAVTEVGLPWTFPPEALINERLLSSGSRPL